MPTGHFLGGGGVGNCVDPTQFMGTQFLVGGGVGHGNPFAIRWVIRPARKVNVPLAQSNTCIDVFGPDRNSVQVLSKSSQPSGLFLATHFESASSSG